jgi:uncharacterized protein with HEPN domain
MPSPDDRAALRDIEHSAGLILELAAGTDEESFLKDWVLTSAVERKMRIIGEAVNHLTPEFRQAHPAVNWRSWIDFRNILVHAYDHVDPPTVWEVVQEELEPLGTMALAWLDELIGESGS